MRCSSIYLSLFSMISHLLVFLHLGFSLLYQEQCHSMLLCMSLQAPGDSDGASIGHLRTYAAVTRGTSGAAAGSNDGIRNKRPRTTASAAGGGGGVEEMGSGSD
jgi:hypothetical protein